MEFLVIGAILIIILVANNKVSIRKFVKETEPYFRFLMEEDYEFLLNLRYGPDVKVQDLYGIRVRDGIVATIGFFVFFIPRMNTIYLLICIAGGYMVFKSPYNKLKKFYSRNLYHINLMLPYYLKSLEILIQHYTVPVALGRSISTAPEIFKVGLERLMQKIDAGDSSVEPYMDFAKDYPVRDSMRMMRLLYRLGLGSQENKQKQLMMLSKTVSSLQNKARDVKYQDRLDKMEKQTMKMLFGTGAIVMVILLIAVTSMMNL